MNLIYVYLLLLNIVSFLAMGLDKSRAKRHKWRIPEKTLFLLAIAGGSIGSILGMQVFRHKTKHTRFVIGMPCIFLLHLGILMFMKFLL